MNHMIPQRYEDEHPFQMRKEGTAVEHAEHLLGLVELAWANKDPYLENRHFKLHGGCWPRIEYLAFKKGELPENYDENHPCNFFIPDSAPRDEKSCQELNKSLVRSLVAELLVLHLAIACD